MRRSDDGFARGTKLGGVTGDLTLAGSLAATPP